MNSKCVLLGSTETTPPHQTAVNFINIYPQFQCLSHGPATNGYYDTKPGPCLGDTDCYTIYTAVSEP